MDRRRLQWGICFTARRVFACSLLTICVFLAVATESIAVLADDAAPRSQKVNTWVRQLDSNQFVVRKEATLQLIEAGAPAVKPVLNAIDGANREVTARGVFILQEIALSDEPAGSAAITALEILAKDQQSVAGRAAKEAIGSLRSMHKQRAREHITALGGKFSIPPIAGAGFAVPIQPSFERQRWWLLEIGEDWRGKGEDLQRLKWLDDVSTIRFVGRRVENDWLPHVAKIENLNSVELKRTSVTDQGISAVTNIASLRTLTLFYNDIGDDAIPSLKRLQATQTIRIFGCKVTQEGAEALKKALPHVAVDYRRGAFLGVGCDRDPQRCPIRSVHPNSAAQKAGLRRGDIVIAFDGKPVKTFDDLTRLIGVHHVGDDATIDVMRRGAKLSKTLKLGEWD